MRTAPLIIIFYVVFLALSISAEPLAESKETNLTEKHFDKNFGPLHIHVRTAKLPPESNKLRWDDKYATLKATLIANVIKDLPKLNPFEREIFGPYDASVPDLHYDRANLTFENVIVNGIKELKFIPNVIMQLDPTRIHFNASIPNITVEADFKVDSMFENDLPIRDSGHFKATLLDLFITAVIGPDSVEFDSGDAYQVESALISIDLKDFQLQMDAKYAKEIESILDEFYKHTEDLLMDNDVLNVIIKAINQELEKIPAKKIVNYLLGPSEPDLKQFGPLNRRKSGRKHGTRKWN